MSAIMDGGYPIVLKGKEYKLLFSLNALDALQDKFGGYDQLDEIFTKENKNLFKDLRWLLTTLINEGLNEGEEELTEMQVGRMIHLGNLGDIKEAIFKSFAAGVNGDELESEEESANDDAENDGGNRQGAQE